MNIHLDVHRPYLIVEMEGNIGCGVVMSIEVTLVAAVAIRRG